MKKLKLSLASVAFVLGITAAFAFKPAETQSSGNVLHWFTPGGNSYVGDNTLEDEKNATGCRMDADGCEAAYDGTQLNNPNDPGEGVKDSERDNPIAQIRQ